MNKAIRLLLSLLFYCLTGVGISLTIKAGIGVSSFNSLNVAVSESLTATIGAVTTAFNGLFLITYIILDRIRHPARYLLQAVAALCLGNVIDFFVYGAFGGLMPDGYVLRVLLFIFGTGIAGFSTGMVLSLKILAFPIESTCAEVCRLTSWPFRRVRYALDVVFVSSSLILSLSRGLPFFVREGTLISLFLLTAAISAAQKGYEMLTRKKA